MARNKNQFGNVAFMSAMVTLALHLGSAQESVTFRSILAKTRAISIEDSPDRPTALYKGPPTSRSLKHGLNSFIITSRPVTVADSIEAPFFHLKKEGILVANKRYGNITLGDHQSVDKQISHGSNTYSKFNFGSKIPLKQQIKDVPPMAAPFLEKEDKYVKIPVFTLSCKEGSSNCSLMNKKETTIEPLLRDTLYERNTNRTTNREGVPIESQVPLSVAKDKVKLWQGTASSSYSNKENRAGKGRSLRMEEITSLTPTEDDFYAPPEEKKDGRTTDREDIRERYTYPILVKGNSRLEEYEINLKNQMSTGQDRTTSERTTSIGDGKSHDGPVSLDMLISSSQGNPHGSPDYYPMYENQQERRKPTQNERGEWVSLDPVPWSNTKITRWKPKPYKHQPQSYPGPQSGHNHRPTHFSEIETADGGHKIKPIQPWPAESQQRPSYWTNKGNGPNGHYNVHNHPSSKPSYWPSESNHWPEPSKKPSHWIETERPSPVKKPSHWPTESYERPDKKPPGYWTTESGDRPNSYKKPYHSIHWTTEAYERPNPNKRPYLSESLERPTISNAKPAWATSSYRPPHYSGPGGASSSSSSKPSYWLSQHDQDESAPRPWVSNGGGPPFMEATLEDLVTEGSYPSWGPSSSRNPHRRPDIHRGPGGVAGDQPPGMVPLDYDDKWVLMTSSKGITLPVTRLGANSKWKEGSRAFNGHKSGASTSFSAHMSVPLSVLAEPSTSVVDFPQHDDDFRPATQRPIMSVSNSIHYDVYPPSVSHQPSSQKWGSRPGKVEQVFPSNYPNRRTTARPIIAQASEVDETPLGNVTLPDGQVIGEPQALFFGNPFLFGTNGGIPSSRAAFYAALGAGILPLSMALAPMLLGSGGSKKRAAARNYKVPQRRGSTKSSYYHRDPGDKYLATDDLSGSYPAIVDYDGSIIDKQDTVIDQSRIPNNQQRRNGQRQRNCCKTTTPTPSCCNTPGPKQGGCCKGDISGGVSGRRRRGKSMVTDKESFLERLFGPGFNATGSVSSELEQSGGVQLERSARTTSTELHHRPLSNWTPLVSNSSSWRFTTEGASLVQIGSPIAGDLNPLKETEVTSETDTTSTVINTTASSIDDEEVTTQVYQE